MTGASVPVTLHINGFDPGRIRWQHRGTALLIMDRVSGRWVSIPDEWRSVLAGLGTAGGDKRADARLRSLLMEHGVGVRGRERTFSDLNTLIIKITAACNQACAYCYDYDAEAGARRIDLELACRAIEQAIAASAERLQVILHGGEPMLAWPLVEQIVLQGEQLAEGAGCRISFVGQTNLSRLTPAIGRFSVEHDIQWGVSVDGPREIHDHFRTYRDGRGTYDDFERALHRFPRFVRSCAVLSTITSANHNRLLEVARHFRDLGMPSWDWSLFHPTGRGRDGSDRFEVDIDTLVDSWANLFAAVIEGEMDGFTVQPVLKYVDNFLHGPGANMCMRPQCGAARDLLSVATDGRIEACDCIDPTGPLAGLGNLTTESLQDARGSELAQYIRGRDMTGSRCDSCIWWGVCGGGCMAHGAERDAIPDLACALALRAFDSIAAQLVHDDGPLRRYLDSVPGRAA